MVTVSTRATQKQSGNCAFLLCGLDTGLKMIIIMVGRRQGAFAGVFSLAGKRSEALSGAKHSM
jgi:hypothetical protein